MPFTLAHPAAAVPLRRYLGRFSVFSALVIGSMVPDSAYFLSWSIARSDSHSFFGLFWYCLPIGLIAYVLFHVVLKGPLLALMPSAVLRRLGDYSSTFRALPLVPWSAVVVSLLCGSATHLLWDAFTHENGPGVIAFPILEPHLFSVGYYDVNIYRLLQHGSTLLGLALLTFWLWRWLATTPPRPASLPLVLSKTQQYVVIAVIAGLCIGAGLWAGSKAIHATVDLRMFANFTRRAIIAALPTATFALVVYSIAWHTVRWRVVNDGADG